MAVAKPKPAQVLQPDDRQQSAIEHVAGPILVVAGAGTGKTTVLTQRIARLIEQGQAKPDEILALTYTENAAVEMGERICSELPSQNLSGLKVKTFHAYCNELLIRHGRGFDVLDDQDLWIFVRRRIRELHLSHFAYAANVGKFLSDLLDFIRRCLDELVTPERYAEFVGQVEAGMFPIPRVGKSKDAVQLSREDALGRSQEIARVFAKVEEMLREQNLGTFGHMITRAAELLENDASALEKEKQGARFILVDEFQDANFAQVKILKKLAGDEQNIFAVGDPDQAIYKFRGASSAAFALFQQQFPGAKLVVLDRNRRSTTAILNSAFSVIAKNPDFTSTAAGSGLHYQRTRLISTRDEQTKSEGGTPEDRPVEAVIFAEKEGEGFDAVEAIEQIRKKTRCEWKDFAVLYRQHIHRDLVAAELATRRIPFSIENLDVMDTRIVRDLLAALACAGPGGGDSASWLRVAAFPAFNVKPEELRAAMRSVPRDQRAAAAAIALGQVAGGPEVLTAFQELRERYGAAKCSEALAAILRRFQFDRKSPVVGTFVKFVQTWEQKAITETKQVLEFLEYVDWFREAGGVIGLAIEDRDAVRLMSVHAAKGLEFKHVFILRVKSQCFPSSYKESLVGFPMDLRDEDSIAIGDDKTFHEQEERRLFYVALTRARDTLTIYGPKGTGKKDPTPPGYLREMLQDHSLQRWLRQRQGRGLQTVMFAQGSGSVSRTEEWLSLPPAHNLATRMSASAVDTYETCPLKFKLQRDWNLSSEAPAAMQYGATMHRVLLAYYDAVRKNRPLSEEEVISLFRTDLQQASLQDAYQFELYERQGVEQLREFLRSASQRVPEVLHTEEQFEVKLGNTTVVGRIDRIDRDQDNTQVVITDYKTGKPRSQEDADDSLQLSIYALAAQQKWGYQPGSLILYNLGDNSAIRTARSQAELQAASEKVQEVAGEIAAGHFEATPGFQCRTCDFRNLCPATEKTDFSFDS
jgi:DNA helicase-2/ATP-dependent DNA helicase PcrA